MVVVLFSVFVVYQSDVIYFAKVPLFLKNFQIFIVSFSKQKDLLFHPSETADPSLLFFFFFVLVHNFNVIQLCLEIRAEFNQEFLTQ